MRRSTVVGLLAVPVALAGLYWLMLHGFLELTIWLLAAAVIGLIVAAAWEGKHGHPKWAALLVVGAVTIVGVQSAYAITLNSKLDNITKAPDTVLDKGHRPPRKPTEALNILLMGSDDPAPNPDKPTVAELLAHGGWTPGAYRSDTIMVLHITADREHAYLVSIPRDSFVEIYDGKGKAHGKNKINAAFAEYGPFGTWRTVENLSGLHLDHMAIIDYAGFRELTTAVGGVDVYVPEDTYDTYQHQEWTKGWHHIEGDLALKYVRQRHGLTNGDFDRVDRQQNFLRTLMAKMLRDDTIGNPAKLSDTLDAVTSHLTVDEGWSNGDLRSLVLSLRNLDTANVKFLTLPLSHYEDIDPYGSVNIIDDAGAKQLWRAVTDDKVGKYIEAHPGDVLPDPKDVS